MAGKFREWLKGIGGGGDQFMGKFGTGQGAIADAFNPVERPQNQFSLNDLGPRDAAQGDTGMTYTNPQSFHQTRIDTGNIDFGDPQQVAKIQEILAREGYTNTVGSNIGAPLAVDSIWGQNTEDAYRQYINQRRTGQGLDAYTY